MTRPAQGVPRTAGAFSQLPANRQPASLPGLSGEAHDPMNARSKPPARPLRPTASDRPIRIPRAGSDDMLGAAPNGGSRVTVLTSDRHGARLVFQSASVLIAEYLLYRAALPVLDRKYRSFNYARAR